MTGDQKRLEWVDAAKAVCILLVVLYHSRHLTWLLEWEHKEAAILVWSQISALLKPLRMPLFFLLSGLLAAPALDRDWSEVAGRRVFKLFYVYGVWALLLAAIIPAFPTSQWSGDLVASRLPGLLGGGSPAWYLWALPTFFLFGWATRHLSALVPIGVGVVAAFAAVGLDGNIPVHQVSMLRCLVFFLIGFRLPHLPIIVAASSSPRSLSSSVILLVFLTLLTTSLGMSFNPAVDAAAVFTAVLATKLACDRSKSFCSFGSRMSRKTLPIYLIHFPILAGIAATASAIMPDAALKSAAIALLFPALAAAVSVIISLIFYSLLTRAGGRWLFEIPQRVVQQVSTRAAQGNHLQATPPNQVL
jgi:uncharacterized membrane protein YcfT